MLAQNNEDFGIVLYTVHLLSSWCDLCSCLAVSENFDCCVSIDFLLNKCLGGTNLIISSFSQQQEEVKRNCWWD